jgi:hypothetical protein
MRRIMLSCALLAVLSVPAVAAARTHAEAKPGYVVVRNAASDGGVNGHAIVTVVVHGFVLGSVNPKDQAQIDISWLPSPGGQGAPQTTPDVSKTPIKWKGRRGEKLSGSGFRFRATGGYYRVVVRGSGVYLYVGGQGTVTLHGSSYNRRSDGFYSIDGAPLRSLPARPLTRRIGRG